MTESTHDSSDNISLGDLLEMVACQLQCRFSGQISELRLAACDDGIILQGYAQTYYAKQRAMQAVMDATGLPVLANEIEVS